MLRSVFVALLLAALAVGGSARAQTAGGVTLLCVPAGGGLPVPCLTAGGGLEVATAGIGIEGTAPSVPGVGVDGVDAGGLKRTFLTDTAGRMQVGGTVSVTANAGTVTSAAKTCGTASTNILASAAATNYILIKNLASNSQTAWVGIGTSATLSSPSIDLAPGQSITFSNGPDSFLPNGAGINCIASASEPVTVLYK